jgi:hypothetical protein
MLVATMIRHATLTAATLAWGLCMSVSAGEPAPTPISDRAAHSFYSSVSPPETIPDLLSLLVRLARSGVFSRWDFYTPDNMTRLFGTHVVSEVLDDGIVTVISGHGYLSLVAGPDESTRQLPYLSGIWISASKPNANGWPFCCRLDVQFWGDIPGLDFKNVTRNLGSHWREDRDAEWQVADSRAEPFNPPPKPPTGYMGDAIVVYESYPATRISLMFDSAGRLHSFYAEWPKMPAQEKPDITR